MRIATALIAVSLIAACSSTGKRLDVPVPEAGRFVSMDLTCLHASSSRDVLVGGFLTDVDDRIEGILLRTTDGGENWRRVGSFTYDFRDFLPQSIHFNDLRSGWVAGIRLRRGETIPVVLRTDDGGGHWRDAEIAESRASTVLNVAEIDFSSDQMGKVKVVFEDAETRSILTNVYETQDAGKSWVIGEFLSSDSSPTTDPAQFYISADEGFRLQRPLENGTQILEFTSTGGQTWVPVSQFHVSQFADYY